MHQIEEYYRQLAEEMWTLETRELDTRDVEELMELCADASWGLRGEAREIARARAAKLPFLAAGEESSRRVAFEHEVFFGYFLAGSLHPAISGSTQALSLLGRGRLDTQTADLVIQGIAPYEPQAILDSLAELASMRHPRQEQIGVNAGALAAAVLRQEGMHGASGPLRVSAVTMSGEDLSSVELTECTFERVVFRRTDLRAAKLRGCIATSVTLEGVLVSLSSTLIELAGLDPSTDVKGLQFEDTVTGLLDMTFDPVQVGQLLQQIGLGGPTAQSIRYSVRPPVMDLVGQLCRAYRVANPLGTNHTRWGHLIGAGLGKDIRRVLVDHGLLSEDGGRPTRGPAQEFFRKRFDEVELMEALTKPSERPEIEAAWRDLAAL